jgi:uncharacterized protein
MWQQLAKFVLKNKLVLCLLVLIGTVFMGWQATQVKLSYEFSKAIPTDNPTRLFRILNNSLEKMATF